VLKKSFRDRTWLNLVDGGGSVHYRHGLYVGRHVPQHVKYEHNLCERDETDHHPTDTRTMEGAVGRSRGL